MWDLRALEVTLELDACFWPGLWIMPRTAAPPSGVWLYYGPVFYRAKTVGVMPWLYWLTRLPCLVWSYAELCFPTCKPPPRWAAAAWVVELAVVKGLYPRRPWTPPAEVRMAPPLPMPEFPRMAADDCVIVCAAKGAAPAAAFRLCELFRSIMPCPLPAVVVPGSLSFWLK